MNPMQPVSLRLRQRYKKNRAIIELRSIADHCARTTALSQRSWSFDRPVRTGDVLKLQVVLSPVRSATGRSKTGTCERGLRFITAFTSARKSEARMYVS